MLRYAAGGCFPQQRTRRHIQRIVLQMVLCRRPICLYEFRGFDKFPRFAYGKRGISAGTNARLSGNVAAYAGTLENPMRDPLLFFADSLLRHLYALNTFYIGFLRALPENFLAGCV